MKGFLKKGLGTIPRQDFELLFEVDYYDGGEILTKISNKYNFRIWGRN